MAQLTPSGFYNLVLDNGLSRDFMFRVTGLKVGGVDIGASSQKEVANVGLYARTAALPGRNIEDKPISYGGVEFHMGGRAIYEGAEGYPIEFYCDAGFKVRSDLEAASRNTFDNGPRPDAPTGRGFNVDPQGTITLQPMSKDGIFGSAIVLLGASIRNIGPIEYLIADGTGEVVTFTCTFAYQSYGVAEVPAG